MGFQAQPLPEDIQDEITKNTDMMTKAKGLGVGITTFLAGTMLPGTSGVWRKGFDESSRYGLLKGLAKDIRTLNEGEYNPIVLREQYKGIHKVPVETITNNVDRLSFHPKLGVNERTTVNANTGDPRYTWGDHKASSFTGASSIRLNPGTSEMKTPGNIRSIETQAPMERPFIHELTHSIINNPDNLNKLPDPLARKFMRELNKSSEKKSYEWKSNERIARDAENWQKRMESEGKKITHEGLQKHLVQSIKNEAVIEEVFSNIKAPMAKYDQRKIPIAELVAGGIAYGLRPDGTKKDIGWKGPISMRDGSGREMTEMSIGVNIDGKETSIPSIVPTLDQTEIDDLRHGGKVTPKMVRKAIDFAIPRLREGQSPFYKSD